MIGSAIAIIPSEQGTPIIIAVRIPRRKFPASALSSFAAFAAAIAGTMASAMESASAIGTLTTGIAMPVSCP